MKRNVLSHLAHSAVSSPVNILSDAFASLGRALISVSLVSLAVLCAAWSAPAAIALLGGLLLCVVPVAAQAQSVTFAGGAQTTLPASGLSYPVEVALDSAGDVFITDSGNNRVLELPRTATGYGPQMTIPVPGPGAVTVDSAGDLFVGSGSENDVVELPWTGTGYGTQVTLPFSGLNNPNGLAVDSAGDVFVSDYGNGLAAELPKTETGYGAQVTLPFTGLGDIDFPYVLRAMAVDSDKNVFLADYGNSRVLELPWTGTGYGPQIALPFSGLAGPWGVALDSGGDVFLSDWGSGRVLELPKASTGYGPQVTLPFSGLSGNYGDAVDNDGDVFVVNYNGNNVLELQTVSVNFGGANVCAPGATTPAPCSETLTLNFTVTASGTLGTPKALTLGAPNLDFTLASGSTCTGAVTEGSTCTVNVTFAPRFAGLRRGGVEVVDGSGNVLADVPVYGIGSGPQVTFQPGTLSEVHLGFDQPYGVAVDGSGNLFVADNGDNEVKEVLAAGGYTTIKILGGSVGSPQGVAVDGSGNVFVAAYNCSSSSSSHCQVEGDSGVVYEIFAAGGYTTAKTLAAYPTVDEPWGVAVDGSGNVFVGDSYDGKVKEILAAGGYTTINTLPNGWYGNIVGVAVDGSGNVFLAAYCAPNCGIAVVEMPAAGGYTTFKTLVSDPTGPWGVAVDASGNVFFADYGDGAVKEILAAGGYATVKTLLTGLSEPTGLAVDGSGNVFVGLTPSGGIGEIHYADPPSVVFPTATDVGATDTADGPQTVSVWNSGNQPLLFATPASGDNPDYAADFPENSADASLCAAGLTLAAGTSCDVSMNFVPSAEGVNAGSVVLTDNALNQSGATQTISPSGIGIDVNPNGPPLAWVSPTTIQFGAIAFGSAETLPLTVTNIGGGTLTVAPSINGPSYTITGNTCTGGLAAGQSCTLQVQFSPVAVSYHDDILTLQTNGATNPTVALDGRASGVGAIETGTPLKFGTIPFGTTKVLLLTIYNFGVSGTVTLGTKINGPSYKVLTNALNTCLAGITAGQSCTLPIEFDPVAVGHHDDILTVTPSGGAAASQVHIDGVAD